MALDTAEKLKQLRCASQRDVIMDAVAEMRANEAVIARQQATIERLLDAARSACDAHYSFSGKAPERAFKNLAAVIAQMEQQA